MWLLNIFVVNYTGLVRAPKGVPLLKLIDCN